MPVLATSALDAMKQLPPSIWLKIGIGVAILLVAVFVLRKVFAMNRLVMGVIIFVVGSIIFFSWIYNRNEPKFLTPIVDRLAPFFPTAGAYKVKQQTTPKR